ncbi:MAG: saccharopine dehydrogenase NADP-binding domain-containing protein [Alphaproteobacteria bacterium]|nr:saccharopine dehydrogenase NADP-binding domain-containing protein [Alphaproteobacteria bacterium]
MADRKYAFFKNHMFMIGFGSIGQGTLPLILRHFDIKPEQITIITADDRGHEVAAEYGVTFIQEGLRQDNYRRVLGEKLHAGDFVVNVSVDVSSVAIIELCQEKGALYVDTVVEPWANTYLDPNLTPIQRSNYAMRESALALQPKYPNGHTAVLCHGANPGLVNHFVKQALLNMAHDTGLRVTTPSSREDWGKLARSLNVKTIHIAERDTQVAKAPKRVGEFVGTWSIDGLYGEGNQPAELGWGTHEKALPPLAVHYPSGCNAAIFLNRRGCTTRVRSWTPLEGPYQGFLITHNEAISIADYLTLKCDDNVCYRPTCHYAYHPCDDTVLSIHEMCGKNYKEPTKKRLMCDEIVDGIDELGVLLMGNDKGVYWYGSRLSIQQTRAIAPHNNATTLQVVAAVLSGMVWAIENPKAGIVEPEYMDFKRVLEVAVPYLGDVVGVWGSWSPIKDRSTLFPEDVDPSDPWQFKNILVG